MYTFKDILFGLREEYLENERMLAELEPLVTFKQDKRSIDFHLEKDEKDNYVELYYIVKKKNGLLRKLINAYCGFDTTLESGIMAKTNNDIYQGDTRTFRVEDDNNVKFNEIMTKLNDRYLMGRVFDLEAANDDEIVNVDRRLFLTPEDINAYRRNNTRVVSSKYDPKKDEITFINQKHYKVDYRDMYGMLEMEFPKEKFPTDVQVLIESSNSFGKPTYIYDNDSKHHTKTFEPVDEGKKLILLRK